MNQELITPAFFSQNINDQHLQSMFNSGIIDENLCLNIVKPDPAGMEDCWAGLEVGAYGDQFGYGFMNQNTVLKMVNGSVLSPKKRKADKGQTLQVVTEKEKKIKRCIERDSKIKNQNSNSNNKQASSNASSRDKSKVSEVQKSDYIHVRARRGQATDSHSLAERVRREKISEKMKYLQGLVPGCNKITGKAGMLDEIINYVQSLQKQVEFLSMKLAMVNPELDFNIDNIFTKEMFESAHACSSANSAYFDQLNSLDQAVSYSEYNLGIKSAEMGLRNISSPVSVPETFMDSSSCFNVISSDFSNLFFEL